VYGMLAVGLLLFCLRYLTEADKWNDCAAMISTWMAFFNLFPLGIVQLYYAVDTATGMRAASSFSCCRGEHARVGPPAGRRCVHS